MQNWQLWAAAAALSAAVTALLIKVGVQGVDAGMATLFRALAVALVLALRLLASGRLYFVSREKGIYVVAAKPQFELLSHTKIEGDDSIFERVVPRLLDLFGVAPPYWRFLPTFLKLPPLPLLRTHFPEYGSKGASLEG